MKNLTIFLNTHSSCADVWPLFFGAISKHWPDHPPAVAACDVETELTCELSFDPPEWLKIIEYDRTAPFGQQYLQGLSYVTTDYVLPLLEDMILFGDVDTAAIEEGMAFAGGPQCEVRLTKVTSGRPLYSRDQSNHWRVCEDVFTMQATIHRTGSLLMDAVNGRHCKTPWEWEEFNRQHKRTCVEPVAHGPKRGRAHYQSLVFPYIATALNKGFWTTGDYPELKPLLKQYGIEPSIRGEV